MFKIKFSFKPAATAVCLAALALSFTACSDDDKGNKVEITGTSVTTAAPKSEIKGMYLLNEGQMNKNKCSLDYFDYTSGKFYNNLFAAINPDVTLGLGDTGNDLKIYKDRLYAVVNVSGIIEVMNAATARHIGYVELAGCRSIAFSGDKAYVTSYAGTMDETTKLTKGTVAEIDLKTLKITRTCTVGYQPEGIVVKDGKLYVANSVAYEPDYTAHYEKTVSVIDASTMSVEKNIDVAENLNSMQLDNSGQLYVISRGNYYTVPSNVYVINTATDNVEKSLDVRAASMYMAGDSLYIVANEFSYETYTSVPSFTLYNTQSGNVVSAKFITDGTDASMASPYGVAVNPENGDIFIPDAGDYINPGTMFCYNREGKLLWKAATGDIPGHMEFTTTKVRGLE